MANQATMQSTNHTTSAETELQKKWISTLMSSQTSVNVVQTCAWSASFGTASGNHGPNNDTKNRSELITKSLLVCGGGKGISRIKENGFKNKI